MAEQKEMTSDQSFFSEGNFFFIMVTGLNGSAYVARKPHYHDV